MDLSKLRKRDLPARRPGSTETEWVIEMVLRRRNSIAYRAGFHILSNLEVSPNPALVAAAVSANRPTKERLRLLDTILEIGRELARREYDEISRLYGSEDSQLQSKVWDVLTTLCPDGPPPLILTEAQKRLICEARRLAEKIAGVPQGGYRTMGVGAQSPGPSPEYSPLCDCPSPEFPGPGE